MGHLLYYLVCHILVFGDLRGGPAGNWGKLPVFRRQRYVDEAWPVGGEAFFEYLLKLLHAAHAVASESHGFGKFNVVDLRKVGEAAEAFCDLRFAVDALGAAYPAEGPVIEEDVNDLQPEASRRLQLRAAEAEANPRTL